MGELEPLLAETGAEIRVEADERLHVDDAARRGRNAAMDRYADGDDAAFDDLYDDLAPRLRGFLARQLREAAATEDLLQQTFLQMHHARATYVRGADVLPWAFAIARRLLIDRHRRRRPEVELDDDALRADGDGRGRPDRLLEAKQAAARLDGTLARMPAGQRAAFELLKLDGLTLAEAAETLGISVGAVKVRAHRAYEALKASLDENERARGAEQPAKAAARASRGDPR